MNLQDMIKEDVKAIKADILIGDRSVDLSTAKRFYWYAGLSYGRAIRQYDKHELLLKNKR
ncbi:hypothetical protein LCGC14_1401890 [marine sediment metagenome]|uniref:Uncharacterized protein n=1 Tax=marine sediment metagenome TaxID=412755 RepID=A0A0F9JWX7_9ZZZZ